MDQSDLQAPVWQLSERARKLTSSAIREILKVTERPEVISFAGGLPSPATFPAERMREASDRILRDYGVKPQYTMEFDNIETIKRAVEIGLGCAIVPRLTVENEMTRGSLKMIEFQEGPFTRPLAIIYKRGRELSPAARKFIEVLTTSNLTPHAQGHSEKATRDRDRADRERGEHRERAEKTA